MIRMEGVADHGAAPGPVDADVEVAKNSLRSGGIDDGEGPPLAVGRPVHGLQLGHPSFSPFARVGHLPVLIPRHLWQPATLVGGFGVAGQGRPQNQPLGANWFKRHNRRT